jgi:hypothetical protein
VFRVRLIASFVFLVVAIDLVPNGPALAGTQALCFSSTSHGTGVRPWGIAIRDFNGDQFRDLAIANNTSNDVSILLGKGGGHFGFPASYPVGDSPQLLSAKDLDSNGTPDLVTADTGSGQVSVLLGRSNGTFRPAVSYDVGRSPQAVKIGRFNADGRLDLAVATFGADYSEGTVAILLGKGDGTFRPAVHFNAGVDPVGVNDGDFNHDGNLDLAVPNNNPPFGISILLGNGDGSFQAPVLYSLVGINARGPAVADFNGDGDLDLGVATYQFPSGVSVLLGNGDGTFQPAVDYPAGENPNAVVAGKLTTDNSLDLVTANIGGNTVSILRNRGDGTFSPRIDVNTGHLPASLAVADLNQDGRPDIAVTDSADNAVSVLLQVAC